jgi:hypothetical protein
MSFPAQPAAAARPSWPDAQPAAEHRPGHGERFVRRFDVDFRVARWFIFVPKMPIWVYFW